MGMEDKSLTSRVISQKKQPYPAYNSGFLLEKTFREGED